MLNIDTTTMLIALTRGDTVSIQFGAVDASGGLWNPSEGDETITLAVAKKWGGEVLMECSNTYDGVEKYKEVTVTEATFKAHKNWYYTESGGVYTQCTDADEYDENETYYMRDCDEFWTITIEKDDWLDDDGNDKFKFSDYVYDVQIDTSSGSETIIGKTDDITPTFRVLGEVAVE